MLEGLRGEDFLYWEFKTLWISYHLRSVVRFVLLLHSLFVDVAVDIDEMSSGPRRRPPQVRQRSLIFFPHSFHVQSCRTHSATSHSRLS